MPENDSFDPQMFLPYLLNQAAETCSLDFQKHYKDRYGLLRTEWRVLFHLGIYGRMSAGDISRKARMHKTKISRAVQRLAERRFITRIPDASDRRVEQLELTRAGRAVYADLHAVARDYDARLMARFPPDQARLLRRMLVTLAGD